MNTLGSNSEVSARKDRPWIIVLLISGTVIAIDQLTKWTVLRTMSRQQSIDVLGDWLKLTFTENPGMAFGIEYGPPAMITIFSIIATFLILLYTVKVGHIYKPYQFSLAMVLGGALGNIIDRVFYGALLYDAPLFVGKVVDFIHVNVWRGVVSDAVPFFGGKYIALFPIWNVADMAIVAGVCGILYFQKAFHDRADMEQPALQPTAHPTDVPSTPVDVVHPEVEALPVAVSASTDTPPPAE